MIDRNPLAALRTDYSRHELAKSAVKPDPFEQFAVWFDEALAAEVPEPNAMTLATADIGGNPSVRVVLLKGFDKDGFVFFTNYGSRKAADLAANPSCSVNFFWKELERQVIISGRAARTSDEESDAYFASRPLESRIAALASRQSSVIADRAELENKFAVLKAELSDGVVQRPTFWGGFRIAPSRFEFWQGRPSRLHDRICYSLSDGSWEISRLSP